MTGSAPQYWQDLRDYVAGRYDPYLAALQASLKGMETERDYYLPKENCEEIMAILIDQILRIREQIGALL